MDNRVELPVIQVVGFQNSGKTTLVETLLAFSNEKQLRVGVIKHHGHNNSLAFPDKNKDTGRFKNKGASITSVAADKNLELYIKHMDHPWNVEEIVSIYKSLPIDLIIIEGFKQSAFPKILMIRQPEDLKLLNKLKNVVCIITWIHEKRLNNAGIPIIQISEVKQCVFWIFSLFGIKLQK